MSNRNAIFKCNNGHRVYFWSVCVCVWGRERMSVCVLELIKTMTFKIIV